MPCSQCQKTVSDADRIVCRGYCGAEFHVICAKVDIDLLDQMGLYERNVFWMCDGCAELFSKSHFRAVVGRYNDEHTAAIQSMQTDIAKLNAAVAALAANGPPATPTWPNSERPRMGAKRRLQSTSNPKPTLPPPTQGKKVLSMPISVVQTLQPDDTCGIWLGNFSTTVTEADICKMVRECLSCADGHSVEARALVKKGVEVGSMRSVTFKVGVDKRYHNASLDENNWPAGVVFREFVDFGKKSPSDEQGFPKKPLLAPTTA